MFRSDCRCLFLEKVRLCHGARLVGRPHYVFTSVFPNHWGPVKMSLNHCVFAQICFLARKSKKNTHIYTFRNDIAQSMKYPPRTQHTYTHKANRDTQHATQENKCNLKVRWWLILIDGRWLQSPGRAGSPSSVGGVTGRRSTRSIDHLNSEWKERSKTNPWI